MKKIIALLTVLSMAVCLVPSFALAEDLPEMMIIDALDVNFDDKTGLEMTTINSGDPEHGKIAQYFSSGSTSTFASLSSGAKGNMVFEMDMNFITDEEGNNRIDGKSFGLLYMGNAAWSVLSVNADSTFSFAGSETDFAVYNDTWYKIRITVERGTGNMAFYVNDMTTPVATALDTKVKTPYRTYTTGSNPASFEGGAIRLFVDNIKMYFTSKPYLANLACDDRNGSEVSSDAVDYKATGFDILFTEEMDISTFTYNDIDENDNPITKNSISIVNQFGREIAYTGVLGADNKTYTVTLDEPLRAKTTYSVTGANIKALSGVYTYENGEITDTFTKEFTTGFGDFAITDVVEGSVDGDNITYDVDVQNLDGSDAATLVVAKYDGDILVSVGVAEVSATDTYSVTVKNEGSSVEAYIMAADGSFKLLDKFSE